MTNLTSPAELTAAFCNGSLDVDSMQIRDALLTEGPDADIFSQVARDAVVEIVEKLVSEAIESQILTQHGDHESYRMTRNDFEKYYWVLVDDVESQILKDRNA